MAHHILAILISTVASESTFSMGERILDSYRSQLDIKTVEALICAQDWLQYQIEDLPAPLSTSSPYAYIED
ncbi:unnamed protein product [Victoria cruziana]